MLEVLKSQAEYEEARDRMRAAGRSALDAGAVRWLRRRRLLPGLSVGDHIKSWDVDRTLDLIDQRLGREAAILDLGAFCSEVPVALAKMGYRNVHGIDLNPRVRQMPFSDVVRYAVGDFKRMAYADASFDAITAISVIEHGYDPEALLGEVARLLKPGGLFIASFDYWPDKVDTGRTTFFGLSWLIFSRGDFEDLLQVASRHGLTPLGRTEASVGGRVIQCAGFDYTFAWTVLQKR